MIALPMFSGGRRSGSSGFFQCEAETSTKRFAAALTTKAEKAPTAATRMPPSAGPTERARLKPIEFSATAEGRSDFGTSSLTMVCQAGLFSALPVPTRKVKASNPQGESMSKKAARARSAEIAQSMPCDTITVRRRPNVSATAPAGSENSISGSAIEVCTSATISGEPCIEVISQDAPTVWISQPKFAARPTSQ